MFKSHTLPSFRSSGQAPLGDPQEAHGLLLAKVANARHSSSFCCCWLIHGCFCFCDDKDLRWNWNWAITPWMIWRNASVWLNQQRSASTAAHQWLWFIVNCQPWLQAILSHWCEVVVVEADDFLFFCVLKVFPTQDCENLSHEFPLEIQEMRNGVLTTVQFFVQCTESETILSNSARKCISRI